MELSTPMVSKHVMFIEKRVGVRLLNRNTRNLSLTEAGRLYFERCKAVLEDLEQTEAQIGALTSSPRGMIRVSAPSWVAGQRVADLLAEFQRRYPEIVVDVSFEDRNVDLVEEGYDLALRVASANSLSNTLIARAIRPMTFYLAASRDYVKRHGAPKTLDELSCHAFVAVGSLDSLRLTGADGRTDVPVRVVLRYRSLSGVANAVAAGIGIAPVPGIVFEDPLLKDVLVPVLEGNVVREATLYAVYVSRRHVPLKVRTLVDFLVATLSGVRDPRPIDTR
jgi:DNA-binding transcriptional LysR family regulator